MKWSHFGPKKANCLKFIHLVLMLLVGQISLSVQAAPANTADPVGANIGKQPPAKLVINNPKKLGPRADVRFTSAYAIPTYLHNFQIDPANFKNSPVLDRAIVGSFRYNANGQSRILKNKIKEDLNLTENELNLAELIVRPQPITPRQLLTLSLTLGFTRNDLLRLEDLALAETFRQIMSASPDFFTDEERTSFDQEIRARLNTPENRNKNAYFAARLKHPMRISHAEVEQNLAGEIAEFINISDINWGERFLWLEKLFPEINESKKETVFMTLEQLLVDALQESRANGNMPRAIDILNNAFTTSILDELFKISPASRVPYWADAVVDHYYKLQVIDGSYLIHRAQILDDIVLKLEPLLQESRDEAKHFYEIIFNRYKSEPFHALTANALLGKAKIFERWLPIFRKWGLVSPDDEKSVVDSYSRIVKSWLARPEETILSDMPVLLKTFVELSPADKRSEVAFDLLQKALAQSMSLKHREYIDMQNDSMKELFSLSIIGLSEESSRARLKDAVGLYYKCLGLSEFDLNSFEEFVIPQISVAMAKDRHFARSLLLTLSYQKADLKDSRSMLQVRLARLLRPLYDQYPEVSAEYNAFYLKTVKLAIHTDLNRTNANLDISTILLLFKDLQTGLSRLQFYEFLRREVEYAPKTKQASNLYQSMAEMLKKYKNRPPTDLRLIDCTTLLAK